MGLKQLELVRRISNLLGNIKDDFTLGFLRVVNYSASLLETEKGENFIVTDRTTLGEGEVVTYALIIESDNPAISRFTLDSQGSIDVDFIEDVELVEDTGEEVDNNYNLNRLDFAEDEPKISVLKDADETEGSDGTVLAESGVGSVQGSGANVRGVPGNFFGANWILDENTVYLIKVENKTSTDNRVSLNVGYRIEPRLSNDNME